MSEENGRRTNRDKTGSPHKFRGSFESRPMMPKVDLYFFRMEVAERPIKIGRSAATGKRLACLRCGSPYPITTLALVYGEGDWEGVWHDHFADERMQGEWFSPSKRLLDAIAVASRHGSRIALEIPEEPDWRVAAGLRPLQEASV